jgi:nucleoside-diphosphate-sugar epimerase
VLIVGCGDVGLRVARIHTGPADSLAAAVTTHGQARQPSESRSRRVRLFALTSSPSRQPLLRAQGLLPLIGNLDDPSTLRRLAGLATRVVHLAPPPTEGQTQWWRDPRTQALARALRLRSLPRALVYGSTSGVYGDCGGARVAESRPVAPSSPRAQRRVDAERVVRHLGRATGLRATILRIPGIYAPDRPGGTPRDRLLRGTPVLRDEDDVYTNHIHADDLARAVVAALWRGRPQRVIHASDDSDLKMGDYFDLAADLYGLPRPARIPRDAAQATLPLMLLSFMSESRRLDNERLRRELRVRLRYPTVRAGLMSLPALADAGLA